MVFRGLFKGTETETETDTVLYIDLVYSLTISFHFHEQKRMMNMSPNSSYVRETSGITRDRLKNLFQQSSQRQLINRDQKWTQKRILFSIIFLCLVQIIV